jgi:hypothetical protein
MLGHFLIHSGASPRYWAAAAVVVGSPELAAVANWGLRFWQMAKCGVKK